MFILIPCAGCAGNVRIAQLLLGRVPLRPPCHPLHIAKKLGLLSPAVGDGVDLAWLHHPYDRPLDDATTAAGLYAHGWAYNAFTRGYAVGRYWDPASTKTEEPAPFTVAALNHQHAAAVAAKLNAGSGPSREELEDAGQRLALSVASRAEAFAAGLIVSGLGDLDEKHGVPGQRPSDRARRAAAAPRVDPLSIISSVVKPSKPIPTLRRRAVMRSAPRSWHDSGKIALLCTGSRVHINVGPSEGRTPLLNAAERCVHQVASRCCVVPVLMCSRARLFLGCCFMCARKAVDGCVLSGFLCTPQRPW